MLLILHLECTWKNLGGEGKVAKNAGKTIGETNLNKTLDECKDLCRLNSLCKSFSFKVEGGSCILKDRILNQYSKTKKVPGTSTYYEPAACHGNYNSGGRAAKQFHFEIIIYIFLLNILLFMFHYEH